MITADLRPEDIERFESKIFPLENGCWYWGGTKEYRGYGFFKISKPQRIQLLAHRIAYELFVGPVPEKLTIDHLCCVTCCVNPKHMELVTRSENVLRGTNQTIRIMLARGARMECPQGHPYSAENTYLFKGTRACKVCRAVHSHNRYLKLLATQRVQ